MADLPSASANAEALSAAGSAHHEYEQTAVERREPRGLPEAGYSEGLRAQIHQKLRITNPSITFQLPLAD